MALICPRRVGASTTVTAGPVISVEQLGARHNSGHDDTAAIQAAIDEAERAGGGTVLIPGRYRCGSLVIGGKGVQLRGDGGWLVDACLTIRPEAVNIDVTSLGLISTVGDNKSYLLDVSGRNCSLRNVQLVKRPAAGGYQMYIRQPAANCRFNGLHLRGSNGVFLAGTDHLFENFDFTNGAGGDDAFAIKGLEDTTRNITICNGIVRRYSAIVSFGSEIGAPGDSNRTGSVRNVLVENVEADRCTSVAFFKPGALGSDWRHGIVEQIRLRNLTLHDLAGERFECGIRMLAGRGATIRDIEARGIRIFARAMNCGVMQTAAVSMAIVDVGAPARIEGLDLQVEFVDPYSGAPHGARAPGYPIDHIVEIEKRHPAKGSMSEIVLDVEGIGSSFGGIYVGPGLDGAIRIERAILKRVATDPPASLGGGGIGAHLGFSLANSPLIGEATALRWPGVRGSTLTRPCDASR